VKAYWTRTATRQLELAQEYINRDSPGAAERQIDRIEAAIQRICVFPMMGRNGLRAGTREFAVPRTPYIVVYRVRDERIEILAVLHGARNWRIKPESWQSP
jgi:toxin ParE1/3/4